MSIADTWWLIIGKKMEWRLEKNASWSGGRVSYDGVWPYESYFFSYDRIKKLAEGESPDFIFVEGGTNDWAWSNTFGTLGSVDSTSFCGAYRLMLQRLIEVFPQSQIICLSIFPRSEGSNTLCNRGWSVSEANDVIKKLCDEYKAWYVEMDKCGIEDDFELYTIDGLHPNKEGMQLVANHIAEFLNIKLKINTRIINTNNSESNSNLVYSLSGIKIEANHQRSGFYISNGKIKISKN